MTFVVDGLDEILHWLLGWTGFVQVIRPDTLRTIFTERLQQAIRQNSDLS